MWEHRFVSTNVWVIQANASSATGLRTARDVCVSVTHPCYVDRDLYHRAGRPAYILQLVYVQTKIQRLEDILLKKIYI
jgi:hypothetical protein